MAVLAGIFALQPAWAASPPVDPDRELSREVTFAACSGCHTFEYIVMNSGFLSLEEWRAEVWRMRDAFGAPINDQTAAKIINYLAEKYGAPVIK